MIEIRDADADDVAFIWSMVVEAVNWDPDGVAYSSEVIAAQPGAGGAAAWAGGCSRG